MSFILSAILHFTQNNSVSAMNACYERNQVQGYHDLALQKHPLNFCNCAINRPMNSGLYCQIADINLPDFTATKVGPSLMFGFLKIPKSEACYEPVCPNIPSIYLQALLNGENIDYYAFNWLVNRLIMILKKHLPKDDNCKNTKIKQICPNEFHYYNPNELADIMKNILAIDPAILHKFKEENVPEPQHEQYGYFEEEDDCERGKLHEAYFKYLFKLIQQVEKEFGVHIPKDYDVHSVLFTGDAVPASGNVGIELKVVPLNPPFNVDSDNEIGDEENKDKPNPQPEAEADKDKPNPQPEAEADKDKPNPQPEEEADKDKPNPQPEEEADKDKPNPQPEEEPKRNNEDAKKKAEQHENPPVNRNDLPSPSDTVKKLPETDQSPNQNDENQKASS